MTYLEFGVLAERVKTKAEADHLLNKFEKSLSHKQFKVYYSLMADLNKFTDDQSHEEDLTGVLLCAYIAKNLRS